MPLTAGLRNESNERINNALKKLVALDYVPFDSTINAELRHLATTIDSLNKMPSEEIINHMKTLKMDWQNSELFADFLAKVSKSDGSYNEKATAAYQYIQSESKTFSFDIFNKIAKLQ